jgi:hypothetical protein
MHGLGFLVILAGGGWRNGSEYVRFLAMAKVGLSLAT